MIVDLKGKTVLVTGAAGGIGAAIVRAVGEAGGNAIIHYRTHEDRAKELAKSLGAKRAHLIKADLESLDEATRLWRDAVAWKGRVDVLVNNAAVQLWAGVDAELATWDEIWRKTIQVNVLAMARICRDAVHHFRATGGGIVINLSSQAAHRGTTSPESMQYAASKAAIKAFTQSIARAFATDGILAYVVAPGLVKTEMALDFASHRGGVDKLTEQLVMREWVPPEDVANFIVFLATGKARHASGTTVDITGASYIR